MQRAIVWFVILVALLGSLAIVTAQDGERLNNPGMEEGSFGPYTTRRGGEFPIYLPSAWNFWFAPQSGDFFNRGDRTTINPHPGPAPNPREGSRALNISCGFVTCTVAIYQQVSVTEGANIQASAWAQVKACNLPQNGTDCGSAVESGARTRIGIDPNGGTDPNDGDIVWSGVVEPHDRWEQMTVSATTTGTTATLFLYSTQNNTADLNRTYWDQTSLTGGGTGGASTPGATAVPPTPTPVPDVPFVVPQNARPDGSIVHVVGAGDTMDSIAFAYQITRDELLSVNPGMNRGTILRIGQEIIIRPASAAPTEVAALPPAEEPPVGGPAVNPGPVTGAVPASIVEVGAFSAGSSTILLGQLPDQPSFDLTLIPQFTVPDDVNIVTSLNRRAAITTATLTTTLPADEIAVSYDEQLMTFGWQRVDGEASANYAWSTWTLTDDGGIAWNAILTIIANPAPNEFSAMLQIHEAVPTSAG